MREHLRRSQPLQQTIHFRYDQNGNQVQQEAANGLITTLNYDELNRLVEKIDSLGNSTKFGYDANGNRDQMRDVRNSNWEYQYSDSNRLTQINVTGADSSTYTVDYQYDAAGNRTQVTDNGNINNYTYDELSRLTQVGRTFDGATYTTGYQYNKALLTGIKYPGTTNLLNYNYNSLNQLTEVVGFTTPQGITYDADGALKNITYGNGVVTSYSYDKYRRLSNLTTVSGSTNIQNLAFTYDMSNNITAINNKTYQYDANNQLTKAVTPGGFMESKETPGDAGFKAADFTGTSYLVFGMDQQAIVRLDYESSSIGLDFGAVAPKVKKILLVPDAAHTNHRIVKGTFDLYTSNGNSSYTIISRSDWDCVKDSNGVISITLNQAKSMRYLKIHVWFDDRDMICVPRDRAAFLNELAQMLRVYQEAESRIEEYQYDKAGNRTLTKITLVQADSYTSLYYSNSDRLKTDGKNAFKYDDAGNLTEKGNKYTINGDTVTFTATSGNGVEYWVYKYDLLNRLIEVKKNGTIVGEYGYDPEGLRVKKVAGGVTTHYVFQGTEPIFEKRIKEGQADKIRSYVYAGTTLLARVDGLIGEQSHYDKDGNFINGKPVYFYHADHVGSVKAITNFDIVKDVNDPTKYINQSKVVWNADYLPFGQQYMKNKFDPDFEEDDLGFTGKGYDSDVGLYYFNARWYDADTGRFISEDPVADPDNPNLYSYCANNPLRYTDPTGLDIGSPSDVGNPGSIGYDNGGSSVVPCPPIGGGNPGAGGGNPSGNNSNNDGNDNSNNNSNTEVKSEREQQLEMAKEILADKIEQLADQLDQTDPNSQQYKVTFKELQKTVGMYKYVVNELSGSNQAKELTKEIKKVINQKDTQPGYPDDNGNTDTTWCNRAAERILSELGYDTSSILDNAPGTNEPSIGWTDANSMAQNAAEAETNGEIQEVTPEKAQELANKGIPVLAAQDSSPKIGHVGIVAPSNEAYDSSKGPLIGQAGTTNRIDYANNSFKSNVAVHYYVLNKK